MSSRASPRRHALRERDVLAGLGRVDEPARIRPSAITPSSRSTAPGRVVVQLAGEPAARAVGLFGAVEVDLPVRGDVPLAGGARSRSWPSSMHAASSASRSPRDAASSTHLAGELRRAILLLVHPQRGGAAQPDVELEVRVAERLGERGELGEALHPVVGRRSMSRARSRASSSVDAFLRRGRERQRELDDPQGPPRARWRPARSRLASTENRTQTAASPAAFA